MYINLKELGLRNNIIIDEKKYQINCFSINRYSDLIEFIKIKIPVLYATIQRKHQNEVVHIDENFIFEISSYGQKFFDIVQLLLKNNLFSSNDKYLIISSLYEIFYFEVIETETEELYRYTMVTYNNKQSDNSLQKNKLKNCLDKLVESLNGDLID